MYGVKPEAIITSASKPFVGVVAPSQSVSHEWSSHLMSDLPIYLRAGESPDSSHSSSSSYNTTFPSQLHQHHQLQHLASSLTITFINDQWYPLTMFLFPTSTYSQSPSTAMLALLTRSVFFLSRPSTSSSFSSTANGNSKSFSYQPLKLTTNIFPTSNYV